MTASPLKLDFLLRWAASARRP